MGWPSKPMALISNSVKIDHKIRNALKGDQSHPYEHGHIHAHKLTQTNVRPLSKASLTLALHPEFVLRHQGKE
jgi:hypothetical protein